MPDLHPTLAHAAAALGARDPEMGHDAEAALGWLAGDEGPGAITQERLQEFLWSRLSTRWVMSHDERRRVADALGEALDLLGLPRYAAISRSGTTAAILDAYQESRARGTAAFRKAFQASGIDPSDLPDFAWGSVMGLQEARALTAAAGFLELAIAAGDLVPGSKGWRLHREELMRAHLTLARPELGGASYLSTIRAERLDHWLALHDAGRVWPELLPHLAPLLTGPAQSPLGTADPVSPLNWLLERLLGGEALTQTGELNRAFVEEAAAHFPCWDISRFGLPSAEDELTALRVTHDLAYRMKALRRCGEDLTLSPRGRALLADPEAMWRAAARALLPRHAFRAAVGEVTLALLIVEGRVGDSALGTRAHHGVADQGWRDRRTGKPASMRVVVEARDEVLNLLHALDVLEVGRRGEATAGLTPVGRALALETLHHRATGPRSRSGL